MGAHMKKKNTTGDHSNPADPCDRGRSTGKGAVG